MKREEKERLAIITQPLRTRVTKKPFKKIALAVGIVFLSVAAISIIFLRDHVNITATRILSENHKPHSLDSHRENDVINNGDDDVIVKTAAGVFKGFKEMNNEKVSYRFKGIPFAEPPVGQLRWKPPVPKKKLSGIYVANISNTLCIQYNPPPFPPVEREPSEDCLYLHIHTPTLDENANLPVFVWIHGGFLLNVYSDVTGYYPDGEFASEMNVVGVSLSYRLNAFGWLSLEELWQEDVSYGNYGLMDQILGLKWVKENIRNFGGNPDLVTVSGQSSGGTSIFALAASPLADGLFKRGIPMSGSTNFPRNYTEASKDNRIFIERSKCRNYTKKEDIRECFYNMTPDEVLRSIPGTVYPNWAQKDLSDFPTYGLLTGSLIVTDPISLPVAPKDAYKLQTLTSDIDLLIGTTGQEVGMDPPRVFNSSVPMEVFIEKRLRTFNTIAISDIDIAYKLTKTYVKTKPTPQYWFETYVTDARVTCSNNQLVKDMRRSPHLEKTYRYVSAWKPDKVIDQLAVYHDAAHMTDSIALFGYKFWPKERANMTESERNFMQTIRRVFKQFMVGGVVEGTKAGQTIVFNGDGDVVHLEDDYHQKQCLMWNDPKNGFLPYVWIN
ncbi:carboxylesterase 1C-like [Clytia hemisphaerica]